MTFDDSCLFDPNDEDLWKAGSAADWYKGNDMFGLEHPGLFAQSHPWFVANKLFAESMVKANSETVSSILGALLSWKTCTAGQLRAGLSVKGAPPFERDEPNLYGAMNRLGIINVGFSQSERLYGQTVNHVWLSPSNSPKLINRAMRLYGMEKWMRDTMAVSYYAGNRFHVRHNTYAAHAGLMLARDKRVRFASGDGWGKFRSVDPQAVAESKVGKACAADVVALCGNNVLAGIEIQASNGELDRKMQNWARMLAYSPMRRRGLVCVWLQIPKANEGYESFNAALQRARGMTEMVVGDPTVSQRMGIAVWDEWFEHGVPTERFGEYTDMGGTRRSIFDDSWSGCTPQVRDVRSVSEWGWDVARDIIKKDWGWDVTGWTMPEAYRGGFYGFIGKDCDGLH